MKLQKEIATIVLDILDEEITNENYQRIIETENLTDIGMSSLNMIMLLVELENKYHCKIDIRKLSTKDIYSVNGLCQLIKRKDEEYNTNS